MAQRTMDVLVTLDALDCCQCHLTFAVDRAWVAARRRDHTWWYCPNGHQQHWAQESDLEKAQREARDAQEAFARERVRHRAALDQATAAREHAKAAERSASAWKGHATRARRKAAHGVCPAPGCGRTFADLARHMTGQHPAYVAEHGPVKAGD